MQVVSTVAEVRAARAAFPSFGLVPTMGALHDGHLTLVRRAKEACGAVGVSIFVNPKQFGPTEDLAAYPRDLAGDLAKLESVGTNLVWTPTPEIMYPAGYDTMVSVGGITTLLEGASRPGHFDGVATVVTKLFNVFQPTAAFFGTKDAQQLAVIRKLVADLEMPLDIVGVPTVREADGLAMSSRNAYLTPQQRPAATVLHRALAAAEAAWQAGERSGEALRAVVKQTLDTEPQAQVDYVSVAHPSSLQELDVVDPAVGALVSLAVRVGKPRLIDNITLTPISPQDPARG